MVEVGIAPPPPAGHFDVTIIGSGVSTGVPMMNHVLAGACPLKHLNRKVDGQAICMEANKNPTSKNARSNVSILVRFSPSADDAPFYLMIDAGKTMRPACIKTLPTLGVQSIDALLLTHDHADAIFGLDDLRDLQVQTEVIDETTGTLIGYKVGGSGAMRIISNRQTLRMARTAFPYLAKPADYVDAEKTLLRRRVASFRWEQLPHDNASLDLGGLPVRCFPVYHGGEYISLGFVVGRAAATHPFVYISDVKDVPAETQAFLEARPIETLVVDLLRRADHTTHFSFDEAVAFVRKLAPQRAYFVGMASCEVGDHDEVNAELASLAAADGLHMELAYDGLRLPAVPTLPSDPEESMVCGLCAPDGY